MNVDDDTRRKLDEEWSRLPEEARRWYMTKLNAIKTWNPAIDPEPVFPERWSDINIKRWFGVHPSMSNDKKLSITMNEIIQFARALEASRDD